MRRVLGLAVTGSLLVAGAGAALAQQSPAPVPRDGTGLQQQALQPSDHPLFSIFGLPVGVNAPVPNPYSNYALRNFGGQPMNGQALVGAPLE
jgi:hypothetical protein